MITTASKILVHCCNQDELNSLTRKLRSEGFRAIDVLSSDKVLSVVTEEIPNIIIIDTDANADVGLALAEELKHGEATQNIPIFLIVGDTSSDLDKEAINSGADGFLAKPYSDAQLFSRIGLLTRLSTMQEEISLRAITSEKYGVDTRNPIHTQAVMNDINVLIIQEHSTADYDLAHAFPSSFRIEQVHDTTSAYGMLGHREFDAVVVDVRADDSGLLNFCADLRKNNRFYNIPVMVVAEQDFSGAQEPAFESGATDILTRPFTSDQLQGRIEFLVRQQRYRMSMLGVYREARHDMTSDSLTGLYTHGYLLEHLTQQIADAERRPKNLTIGFFDVKNMAGINEKYGYAAGDRLLRQIGGMVGGLVRGEDLPARYSGEEFCVVMPDTTTDAAITAIHRIAGIVNQSEFAIYQVNEPIRVHLITGYANLVGKETAEGLIKRAHNMIQ